MTVVRAAITQVAWTGDKETMIKRHEELARDAAADGVQIIGFQELFYGPYFGIRPDQKYYSYVESIPGPTVERFQARTPNPARARLRAIGSPIVLPAPSTATRMSSAIRRRIPPDRLSYATGLAPRRPGTWNS